MSSIDLLTDLIAKARAAGADAADAVLLSGASLSVNRAVGETKHLERAEGQDLGLRVFLGQRAAIVSSTTVDPSAFAALAERAVAMAKVVPEEPYHRPGRCQARPPMAGTWISEDPAESRRRDADRAEPRPPRTRAPVAGMTNSEGAEAGYGRWRSRW